MTDLERLIESLAAQAGTGYHLLQLGVLAAGLGLAWLIARTLRAQVSARETTWKFGEGGFHRVIFPLAALALIWGAKFALRQYHPLPILDLAVTLLVAFAVIRFAVYVLRHILPDGAFLRGSERTISWVMWIGVVLYVTGLLPEIARELEEIGFTVGKQRISVLLMLQALVSVAVTLAVSMWIARIIEGRVLASERVEMSTRVVIAKLVRAVAFFAAILIALPVVGIDITALSVFGGALGVGLGFGLQKIASNYVSGFIILLDRSIRIGDLVTVDNRSGTVREIASRYTVIEGLDGITSIIPNETLITQTVVNHFYSDHLTLVKVAVTVAHDTDVDAALEVLLAAARAQARILAEPAPGASITRISELGVELELSAWISDAQLGQGVLRSTLMREVLVAFKARGIGLATPFRGLRALATGETRKTPDTSMG